MRGPTGRRPPTERPTADHRYTTPTPTEPPHCSTTTSRRDSVVSDTSFASSRPSSAHSHRQNTNNNHQISITDKAYQTHAIAAINNYLTLNQFHISSLKLKPLPSNKDILETLKFVLSRLDYPLSNKLEQDLLFVLKFFNCPVKFNKSALKTPGAPHCFSIVLAVMHWLVQLAFYNDRVVVYSDNNVICDDSMFDYCLTSYLHYIAGDDDAVDSEDATFTRKIQSELNTVKEKIDAKAENVKELEGTLEAMRSGPSLMQVKEEEKSLLEKDVKKFNDLIEQLRDHEARVEKQMEEKEKQLAVKVEERNMISAENEELKKKVEEQGFNMRDAERMKRELQAVERDIGEAEIERNKWEEKSWDLNAVIRTKWKELEALQLECNQAIRRLKLGNGFQYELNAKGSTPIEVLGDYKSTLKPGLNSSIEEVKRTKMENLESKVQLRQVSSDTAAKIKAKENRIAILQSQIDEVNSQIDAIQKGTQDYISSCEMEARQLQEKFEVESHNVDLVEKEAHEFLENAKAALQETTVRSEEEVQMCAYELLALIDSLSKYKEFTASKISQMKGMVSETAAAIAQVHNDSLASSIGSLPQSEV